MAGWEHFKLLTRSQKGFNEGVGDASEARGGLRGSDRLTQCF